MLKVDNIKLIKIKISTYTIAIDVNVFNVRRHMAM